ncbi:hypothetical protein F2Q68_00019316 [Brassica cretica]|uniref:Uncharacterized protein n=1 Tax=Brassica cretica TaxID=69181 RepID=A0A8S9FSZ1_BRACR|nr:hypothetical protein F2Q68_00019316 [Brassica cretica]
MAPDNLNGTKNVLSMAKTIPLPVDGPESTEWDSQGGGPYAAVVDGRILKWRGDGLGWAELAYTSPHSRHVLGSYREKDVLGKFVAKGYRKIPRAF